MSELQIEFLEAEEINVSESLATRKGKKRKSRTEFFSSEEKKRLAAEVKVRPQIWDISHSSHHNHGAINMAWREIASELLRTPDTCKTAWIALKESHRYRKQQHHKKSGSDGGEPIPGPSSGDLEWEFAEDLAFLPEVSRKRRTFTTTQAHEHDPAAIPANEVELERIDADNPRSNYFYQNRATKSKEDETMNQLAENINQLIEHQKAQGPTTAPTVEDMKYKSALSNVDRMLQQMPQSIIEDTLFEITVLTYNKLKQYQN